MKPKRSPDVEEGSQKLESKRPDSEKPGSDELEDDRLASTDDPTTRTPPVPHIQYLAIEGKLRKHLDALNQRDDLSQDEKGVVAFRYFDRIVVIDTTYAYYRLDANGKWLHLNTIFSTLAEIFRQSHKRAKDAVREEREETPKPRLVIEQYGVIADLDIPPRGTIVHPWVPERGMAMIYGPKGSGKTEFATTIAICSAVGIDAFGWKIEKPHRVLYIDGELTIGDLRARIEAQVAGLGLTDEQRETLTENLLILSRDRMAEMGFLIGYLGDDDQQEALIAAIKGAVPSGGKIDLAIFDNLSCLFGGEENAAETWDSPLMLLLQLKLEFGTTSLIIHHAGKGGDQRGTSRREDNLDTSLRLEPVIKDGELTADSVEFRTVWGKHRGFRLSESPTMICEMSRENGVATWEITTSGDMRLDKLVELRAEHIDQYKKAPSIRELESLMKSAATALNEPLLKVSRNTVHRLLDKAFALHMIDGK